MLDYQRIRELGEHMDQEYRSMTNEFLIGMPENLKRFPGKGNVAINVRHYDVLGTPHYAVEVGERIGDSFEAVGVSPKVPVPEGFDTDQMIEAEISAPRIRRVRFDIFVDGELYRSANR